MPSALDSVTLHDVLDSLEGVAVRRGIAYADQHRVVLGSVDGDFLRARVHGSQSRPYEVIVRVEPRGAGRPGTCSGHCTCPIGRDCKHVAAVFVAWLAKRREAPPTPRLPESTQDFRVRAWLNELQSRVDDAARPPSASPPEHVRYVFAPAPENRSTTHVDVPFRSQVVRPHKDGRLRVAREATVEALISGAARAVADADVVIGLLLRRTQGDGRERQACFEPLMRAVLGSGRAVYDEPNGAPLTLGPPRAARLAWTLGADGRQRPVLVSDGATVPTLAGAVPWYLDLERGLAGPLECGIASDRLATILDAPPVPPRDVPSARVVLARALAGAQDHDLPATFETVTTAERPAVVARLFAEAEPASVYRSARLFDEVARPVAVVSLAFRYGGVEASTRIGRVSRVIDGRAIEYERHEAAELEAAAMLEAVGLARRPRRVDADVTGPLFDFERLADPQAEWLAFVTDAVPRLRAAGWTVSIDDDFPYRAVALDDPSLWHARVGEVAGGWFDLAIDIDVEGVRHALLPIVGTLLREGRLDPSEAGDRPVLVRVGGGPMLALPRERIRAIARTLVEIGDRESTTESGVLRVPAPRAGIVDRLAESSGLVWRSPKSLRDLAKRLRTFEGIEAVPVPKHLSGELRPYQRDGLAWLQCLRSFGFGGILADDMGLGKSVQTLAHLLREKESRRLKAPVLLVVPTSLVFNWLDEAARFAPSLRMLSLHGPDRAERFAAIERHDVVITTYALLPRDAVLRERAWYGVVFDEAQMLKNPTSKAWQTAVALKAEHRLCLTGTPLENHLGDLWSLFAITMPGALGDRASFARLFRTPIEKRGDVERGAELAARIRPFVLRRTKEGVATDLPEKTEIVQRVELSGAQRDLYESVRLTMHAKVREEIGRLGVAKSQIVVLDALLKLRQVCCDPRLLPERLRGTAPSAKLEMLDEMLTSLVEEGRRVLVFSQFTSMLALIGERLRSREIAFESLTGETTARASVVERFQAGEAPVFLISLKAGGTGLNLTAADTVVHYDPWWNPAVERQATDRAHRIGQAKKVFVYKLIGAGTVEEKMLEMQARKDALARSVYDARSSAAGLTSSDIERLFAPLEAVT